MNKKILHISKFYEPYKGGIEDVCRTVVDIISEQKPNSKQIVLCFNDKNKNAKDFIEGIEVRRAATLSNIARQPISIAIFFILKDLLKDFKPNIIHYHAPNPLVAFFLLVLKPKKSKIIVHWHLDIVAQKKIYKLIKPIESKLLQQCYKILATSPNYIEHSQQLLKHKNKTLVLPNVIDQNKFKITEQINLNAKSIREKYNNKPIILFVGRHVPYKGLYYLVEAAKHIKNDAIFLIGGSGPLSEELKIQAQGLTNIHFIGRIPDDDLVPMYYAADIFAFPSITKNEAFGVALAEAMYCGKPAVTFTIKGSGVNWVNINNETGLEVPNSDPVSYASALDSLIKDKEKRLHFGSNAKKRVSNLFLKNRIDKQLIYSIYEFDKINS